MSYLRGNVYWANAALKKPRRRRVSLGTSDKQLAGEIERMLKVLRDRRDWEVLYAAVEGPLTPAEVYDSWTRGTLDDLRRRLNDVDLTSFVAPWRQWLTGRVQEDTADRYVRQLRHLVPEATPFLRSEATRGRISRRLHELETNLSGSTVRRYHAAWSSFFRYLVDLEVLETNPCRRLRLPKPNAARENWLPLEKVKELIHALAEPYRSLAALREGAGVEIGAALRVRRHHVDMGRRVVHVPGTKNVKRDRLVRVDDWAWKWIRDRAQGLGPEEVLWGCSYDAARQAHLDACSRLGLEDYRMHDARHSYAVRHMKAVDDPFLIANQMGHKNATMVLRVYGKYRPTVEDLGRLSNEAQDTP